MSDDLLSCSGRRDAKTNTRNLQPIGCQAFTKEALIQDRPEEATLICFEAPMFFFFV